MARGGVEPAGGTRVIKLAAPVHSVCFAGPDHLIVACAPGIVSVRLL